MSVVVVTGAGGLVGAEAVRAFGAEGHTVVGIDNDLRAYFFGNEASTQWAVNRLRFEVANFHHYSIDIRDGHAVARVFREFGADIKTIIHAAAQPSHDWAAREPFVDFSVNALGTLNLLEATRLYCPQASFLYLSTNKVYGDQPNSLPLIEVGQRFECSSEHPYAEFGVDESMSIDQSKHSLFGASKAAGDLLVQEYGRYFGIKTACFRCGCLTGPGHSGTELHGFLSYLMMCALRGKPYTVYGYRALQVRDNIHSKDLVSALCAFSGRPRIAAVYNMGGGRQSNCSMLEAIAACETRVGKRVHWRYVDRSRIGDHMWWISDLRTFRRDYPSWQLTYSIDDIFDSLYEGLAGRIS
jgi:CDP-paratose 2-epimerase